jgi:hypothetical protein
MMWQEEQEFNSTSDAIEYLASDRSHTAYITNEMLNGFAAYRKSLQTSLSPDIHIELTRRKKKLPLLCCWNLETWNYVHHNPRD